MPARRTPPPPPPKGAWSSPSTERNRGPILEVLKAWLPARGLVLEIAAGAGEHAMFMAAALPGLTWQPTDMDAASLVSIGAWRERAGLANLKPPLILDASDPAAWPVERADAVVAINMVHISPWRATKGLMAGADRVLPRGGVVCLYGPYFEDEAPAAPSNIAFDSSLQGRNPEWGIRRLEDVTALAGEHGLDLAARVAMPANNLVVVFRKV